MYSISYPRLPVQGCQLSKEHMPEDAKGVTTHKAMQATTTFCVSCMQTVDSFMLLPRKALQHQQLSRAILSEHPTKAK
jgi:hypothetical protein